jgi:hypothetical protein
MVPGKKTCMLVDEEGLLKDTVVVNLFASVFYGTSTDIIAGDVIFLNEDGEDFAGLTDEQIKWFDAQYKKCCEVSGRKYECLYS